jgi:hypothetical protein
MRDSRTQAHEKGRNRHRDRNRLLQTNNFDSDGDPDSDADLLGCSFLFSEQASLSIREKRCDVTNIVCLAAAA